jgi:hypothetical protein
MLADGGPPLFFSLMKPASYYELKSKGQKIRILTLFKRKKKKDVGGIITGVSVRKVLTMFVQSSSILLFLNLRRGRTAF